MDGFEQPDLSMEQALELLRSGTIHEAHGLLPWGSNYTILVTVNGGEISALAVYKPRRGERPLWDFPDGTLCQREVAAFEVSRALGWDLVPPTVLRDGPYGPGSVQYFVPHDPEEHYFTFNERYPDQLQRIALLDVIINNADRKGGHCLLGAGERIWAIDHGISFSVDPKLRTVIWDFAGQDIPAELLRDVERLCADLGQPGLRGALEELLTPREIEALQDRIERVLRSRRFPQMGGGRSYPWPPI
ncbi:MAG: SCO1664 family protein [Anaerolineae bacterium]